MVVLQSDDDDECHRLMLAKEISNNFIQRELGPISADLGRKHETTAVSNNHPTGTAIVSELQLSCFLFQCVEYRIVVHNVHASKRQVTATPHPVASRVVQNLYVSYGI